MEGPLKFLSLSLLSLFQKAFPRVSNDRGGTRIVKELRTFSLVEDGSIYHSHRASTTTYKKSQFQKDTYNPADQSVWEQRPSE